MQDRGAIATCFLFAVLAGCAEPSSVEDPAGSDSTASNVVSSRGTWTVSEVEGPVIRSLGTSKEGMAAEVVGELALREGCLLLGGMPVIWPEGTAWEPKDRVLRLAAGHDAPLGAHLEGGGGYLTVDAVTELFGSRAGEAARGCLGPTGEVAVFNPGSHVAAVNRSMSDTRRQ